MNVDTFTSFLDKHGHYYMRFESGKELWSAPKMMDELKTSKVEFGRNPGSFFALFDDGKYQYSDIPARLESRIKDSTLAPESVSVAPEGQWFVRFTDGDWGAGGYVGGIAGNIRAVKKKGEILEKLPTARLGTSPVTTQRVLHLPRCCEEKMKLLRIVVTNRSDALK